MEKIYKKIIFESKKTDLFLFKKSRINKLKKAKNSVIAIPATNDIGINNKTNLTFLRSYDIIKQYYLIHFEIVFL